MPLIFGPCEAICHTYPLPTPLPNQRLFGSSADMVARMSVHHDFRSPIWGHDLAASKAAGEAMVTGYSIVAQPALNSRHTEGMAIDMTISWRETLTLKNKSGNDVVVSTTPRTGENTELVGVGKSFGVVKATFTGDPPHWSSDGR